MIIAEKPTPHKTTNAHSGVTENQISPPHNTPTSLDGLAFFASYSSPQMLSALTSKAAVGGSIIVSDVALKRNIVEIGRSSAGHALYSYRYLWSDTIYVGVMAQDVAKTDPGAVSRGEDGYLRVDYGRLGLRLQTLEQWSANS